MSDEPCKNTDTEIWRETPDDYYAPSIFVTESGGIGINVGGLCIVKPVRDWHTLAAREDGHPLSIAEAITGGGFDPYRP